MKDGSEVLRQRLLHQLQSKNRKEHEVETLEAEVAKVDEERRLVAAALK